MDSTCGPAAQTEVAQILVYMQLEKKKTKKKLRRGDGTSWKALGLEGRHHRRPGTMSNGRRGGLEVRGKGRPAGGSEVTESALHTQLRTQ